jgi:hypothetical protein
MHVKWVLAGFGVLYLLFALSLLPAERYLSAPIEDGWEIVRGVLWGLMIVISIGLLEAVSPLAALFPNGGGLSRMHTEEGLLAAILIALALYSALSLRRKEITPARRGVYVFLSLLAVSLVAMVRFTMYSWGHFSS